VSTPYHHGSLREVLVAEGRRQLLEEGPRAITIRGLAKRAGVSHSAPLRHFRDRLSEYAHAHVRFALENGPLMDLMFSGAPRAADSLAVQAAGRFFAQGAAMLGEQDGGRPGPLPYLLAGTLEGISSLASTGRLALDQVAEVTDAAVALLLPPILEQLDERERRSS
jgi:hypothetical protein